MNTSRRVLLLLFGAAFFVVVFVIYNSLLGSVDGLPELPEKYLVRLESDQFSFEASSHEIRFNPLLRSAFGDGCQELKYSNKLALQAQGLVLATEVVEFENGRLKLLPLSLALFGKNNPASDFPEISTVHCDIAWLTFDRPVNSLSDTNKAKLIAAEFHGDPRSPYKDARNGQIRVTHNHGTPQMDDDIVLETVGPFRFRDNAITQATEPQLTTDSLVVINDYQSQPKNEVTAQGLNIYLSDSAFQPQNNARREGRKSPLVKRIQLPSNVDMKITLGSGSHSFLGSTISADRASERATDTSRLWIHTLGSFNYEVSESRGVFESSQRQTPGEFSDRVEVQRLLPDGKTDRLLCNRIELKFGPQQQGTAVRQGSGESLQVEEVEASGRILEIIAESDPIHVSGSQLTFRRGERRTTIAGRPVVVVKDNQKLHVPEIDLFQHQTADFRAATEQNPLRVAAARGSGVAFLSDQRSKRSIEMRWENGFELFRSIHADKFTITGKARISDSMAHQSIAGDQIQAWFDAGTTPSSGSNRLRRAHVRGNVEIDHEDLRVRETDEMIAEFENSPIGSPTMEATEDGKRQEHPAAPFESRPPMPTLLPPREAEKQRRPILLRARTIEATFVRSGDVTQLGHARCTERVSIRQEAADPHQRGLEAHASALHLTHSLHGDVLKLSGQRDKAASIIANEMTLSGTQIVINQADNVVEVERSGSMRLLVHSTLHGERLTNADEMVIYWNERMTFNGSWASFIGGVQAEHKSMEVLCPRMDVYLNQRVNFRQDRRYTKPSDPKPEITRVICHCGDSNSPQHVTVRETKKEKGEIVQFQQIEAPTVVYSNENSQVEVEGPGEVRLFQSGTKVALENNSALQPRAEPDEQERKLTRVRFSGRMQGHTKDRWAKFFDDIRVTHCPTDDPLASVNEDRLPKQGFAMRCRQLTARTRMEGGKSIATISAIGKAEIFSEEFSGQADQIDYDDGKDQQVIFKSTGATLAALNHKPAKGQPAQEWHGRTIFYWRKTNQFKVVEAAGGTVPQ